jgi:hypothetical protein
VLGNLSGLREASIDFKGMKGEREALDGKLEKLLENQQRILKQ